MKAEADAAKARLDKLNKAGDESWTGDESSSYGDAERIDKANQAVHESIKRVA